MVSQTQVESQVAAPQVSADEKGNGATRLRRDVGELARDIVMLGELQFELLREDVGEAIKKARWALILTVAAAIAALACLPVVILGAAFLISQTGMHLGWSMLLVAVVVLALSGATAAMSWTRLRKAASPLARSQREFRINLNWIKRALGSAHAEQARRL